MKIKRVSGGRARTLSLLVAAVVVISSTVASASDIDRTFTFNAADQLTNVKDFNVTTADFAYDANGERIKATWYEGGVQQSQTVYIRDPQGNVLAEYDGNGALIAQYVYLNGKKLCRIAADGTKTYYHDDPLGTAMAVTDDAGQAVWRGEYYPFGTEYSHSGSRDDTYTFTGHEHDATLGLFYMHARYYDPEVGRFVSTDPVGGRRKDPQSWNRYAYALDNPMRYRDAGGRQVIEEVAVAGAISNPAGAALVTVTVAADQVTPPQYRTRTYVGAVLALQVAWTLDIWKNTGVSLRAASRRARTRPGPQAQPERGKEDKAREDRARRKREKPPRDGDNSLDRDQPGSDKPVPDPDKTPADKKRATKKLLVDLIVDVVSGIANLSR